MNTPANAVDNTIYDRVHTTWWDEDGFMALLRTSVNPPRSAYFERVLTQRLGLSPSGLRVLIGSRVVRCAFGIIVV